MTPLSKGQRMRTRLFQATLLSVALAATIAAPALTAPVTAAPIFNAPPDLTVSLSASPNPVGVGGYVQYGIWGYNSLDEVCTPRYPEPICHEAGRAASNISVSMNIPTGFSYYAGIGDHNFSCPFIVTGNLVTCFGGSLAS